jgi:hypothetical protein
MLPTKRVPQCISNPDSVQLGVCTRPAEARESLQCRRYHNLHGFLLLLCRFLVLTTKIINGRTLLDSFMDAPARNIPRKA